MIFLMFFCTQAAQFTTGFSIPVSPTSLSSEQLTQNGIEHWCKQNLQGLKSIDVAGMPGANNFLQKLFKTNLTLSSLVKVNASNTDITLDTLELLRMIKVPFFVRDLPQYSARFGCSVAPIMVDIQNTELSLSEELEYSVIEQPAGPSLPIYYRCGMTEEVATAQVIVSR